MQDCISDNKIKENKYKILRMSLLLGSDSNREETLRDFEDAARQIDAMNDEVYLKDLQDKFYDTKSLEDEEKKLDTLVNYIDGRVEQRISLLTDFSNITGFDLQDLPSIKYYDKLDDYKERLSYIREYLSNVERLEALNGELKEDNKKLDAAYKSKGANEEFNQRSEEMLLNKFLSIVKNLDYFSDVNEDNIDVHLDNVIMVSQDSKKSLDIFTKSFSTLVRSGIDSKEEEEYHSYVKDAQQVYYCNKEKEYLLRVYQYLIHKESEYQSILVKRDCINDLLYERLNLRQEFGIAGNDILSGLYDILEKQYHDIEHQSENVKAIDDLNLKISQIKEEINGLELDNQKVEILALLREYGIIDTYSEHEEDNSDVDDIKDENIDNDNNQDVSSLFDFPVDNVDKDEEKVIDNGNVLNNSDVVEPVDDIFKSSDENIDNNVEVKEEVKDIFDGALDNQVVLVSDAEHIDLDYVHSKANKVMKRVGEMLGIKPTDEVVVSVKEEPSIPAEPVFPEQEDKKDEEKQEDINPLFSNDVSITTTEQVDTPSDKENDVDGNDFWFPSETPDALEELPDLDVKQDADSNNFFANNSIPDLSFPDLKVDFGNNEEA